MLNLAFQQSKRLAQEVHEVISYGFKIKFITYCNIPNFVSNYDRNKRKSIGTILTRQDMPYTGLSSLGVPGVPWHTQILADQLTLFHPGGTDYAHLITTGTPGFSDLPTAL